MDKTSKNAFQKADKTAIIYPLLAAFIVPGVIGLFHPGLIKLTFNMITILVVSFIPTYVIFRTWYDWFNGASVFRSLLTYVRPLPTNLPMGSDLSYKKLPWATISLILINVLIHLVVTEDIKGYFAFPQRHFDGPPHALTAFFMHAFLHGDNWHLAGNMIFLWVFGSTLEARTGSIGFLALYFACIAASTIFSCTMMAMAGKFARGIGASGAISGIMGLFAVRCYFSRVTFGLPFIPVLPWVTVPVRVQALALICLYFAVDTAGSRAMFHKHLGVGYWSHSGGYLFGFALAFLLRFHRSAAKESVGARAARLGAVPGRKKEAAGFYQEILDHDPGNVAALSFFLDRYRFDSHKQQQTFGRLIKSLAATDMTKAVALYNDYCPQYLNAIPGKTALTMGLHFYNIVDLGRARHCFQVAKNKKGPWQAKATLLLGRTFEGLGNLDAAFQYYRETQVNFPDTAFAREATGLARRLATDRPDTNPNIS